MYGFEYKASSLKVNQISPNKLMSLREFCPNWLPKSRSGVVNLERLIKPVITSLFLSHIHLYGITGRRLHQVTSNIVY